MKSTAMRRSIGLVAAILTLTLAIGCSSNSARPTEKGPGTGSFAAGVGDVATAPAPEAPPPPADDGAYKPDIVTTGTVSMTVASPKDVADKFVAATIDAGGRIASRSEQTGNGRPTIELTLRIPSDKVDSVLANIDKLGVVDSMQIGKDDVTASRVDLDARLKALQTSVNRLLDLMGRAGSTSELLEAEGSLTERQADLDSLKAQRAALGNQIAFATITVNLATQAEAIAPGGFFGAVENGWKALLHFGGGLAATIGFLLPWLPILVLFVAAFWLLRRRLLRKRPDVSRAEPTLAPPNPPVAVETDAPAGPVAH